MGERAAGHPPALRPLRGAAAPAAAQAARRPGGAAGSALRLERVDDLFALRSDWTPLAERTGNVFATWEWADAWWRHFGDGLRLAVGALRADGGATVALLPLCVSGRRPLRVARFLGFGPADELGPVCSRDKLGSASHALARSARRLGWDVLLAERLAAGHGLPGRTLRREASPAIVTPAGGWEEYLQGRSRNQRSQLGRKRRKLEREHELSFRLCYDPERLAGDLGTLFRLHEARWGGPGSGAFDDARVAFHRDFATIALERGWLRLWVAEAGGRPVAAWYGFRFAGVESYYQSGRDPDWDRSSVGLVLLAHTIEAAMDDGMREYRLLRGGEAYKDRFATADTGVETVAAGHGLTGRAAVVAGAQAARLPKWMRRRLLT